MNILGKLAGGLALASLALAQPALAGTRASGSLPAISGLDRIASPVSSKRSEGFAGGLSEAALVIGFLIAAGLLIVVIEESEDDVSPGT